MNRINYSQLYNFYEREIYVSSDDVRNICLKAMSLIDFSEKEKNIGNDTINFLKHIIDMILEKYKSDYNNVLYRNMTTAIYTSISYSRVLKNDDNTYTCYPFSIVEPSYYEIIINYCLANNLTIEESIKDIYNLIDADNKSKHNDFLTSDFNFYYGDIRYILGRTIAVIDAIRMLLNRKDLTYDDNGLLSTKLLEVNDIFGQMCQLANITDLNVITENDFYGDPIVTSKEQYDLISNLYTKMIECENALAPISQKIWNNFYISNGGMLAHKLTSGIIESDQMDKICTSFVSNNIQVLPKYAGNTGYFYKFDINNVLSLCETDVGSWRVTKEEFIERGFPCTWQFDGSNIRYEYPYHSKLFSPEYIENKVLLNQRFAEIVLSNDSVKIKPLMAFYTSNATEEEIQKITDLASKQNIEVVPFSSFQKNGFNI